MGIRQNAWANVSRAFREKQEKRSQLIEARKKDLFARLPRLSEIEGEVASLSYQMFLLVAKGELSQKEVETKLQEKIDLLNKEKEGILASDGKDESYLNPPYECSLCEDTGKVDNLPCSCFKNALIREYFTASNLTDSMKKETFEGMRTDLYSTEKNSLLGCSVKEYMEDLVHLFKDYVKNFNFTKESLLFYGASGLGKTYFSSAIAGALIKEGYSVCYQSASMLFPLLQQKAFSDHAEYDRLLEELLSADLFILDDLGTEMITNFTVPELFKILNGRLLAEKPMIISTNLDMKDLRRLYSERISSRIEGTFTPCFFVGEDLRTKK